MESNQKAFGKKESKKRGGRNIRPEGVKYLAPELTNNQINNLKKKKKKKKNARPWR